VSTARRTGLTAVRDYLQFVSLRVLPDGQLTAHATLVTKCAPRFGDELTESVSVRSARLSEDGHYSARRGGVALRHRPHPLGGPALQPGTHRGTTDQDEPFIMRVARDGRLVRRGGMTVGVGRPSGIGLPLDVVAHRVRVRRGRFGAADEFRRPFTYPDGNQVVEQYSWQLRGRFGRRGARGTFELHGVVHRRSDGERIGSCDTGQGAWHASR
jgi:hypothetical protein